MSKLRSTPLRGSVANNRSNRGIAIVVSAPRITVDWVESLNGINARLIFSLYPHLI